MTWLRKSKWISFLMAFFWDVVPLFVSVISFTSFVLIGKGELTVAIAFPALTAFGLLTGSLTKVPMFANIFVQTYASLKRIDKYLKEDEVRSFLLSSLRTLTQGDIPSLRFPLGSPGTHYLDLELPMPVRLSKTESASSMRRSRGPHRTKRKTRRRLALHCTVALRTFSYGNLLALLLK